MSERKGKIRVLEKSMDFLFNRWLLERDMDFKRIYSKGLDEMEQEYKEITGKLYMPKDYKERNSNG